MDGFREGIQAVKDDKLFLEDLAKSRRAVNEFAGLLRSQGITAWLPPEQTRPNAADRRAYSDTGDLVLQIRVEHKCRPDLSFTCREDYPYQTVFIDEVYNFDQKAAYGPPLAYVIENADRTHVAVVYYAITRPHWKIERHFDSKQQRQCDYYVVDKSRVRFCLSGQAFDVEQGQVS